ncbi:MAG: 23S rRNA (uracil(1939)-C(5))-methyltransferase RlmD [Atopobiaceae bacterium]|jgi:23S rRNA (uracil1939-C5)-methyltransferase
MSRGTQLELSIERMAYGADAIAHTPEGKTAFVYGAVPGDIVLAEVVREEKSFLKARTVQVVTPSRERVVPACPYADVCGGCPWAHMSRALQLKAKRSSVVDALVRIGHADASQAEALVAQTEAPSPEWGYRNKIELGCARQGHQVRIGLHGADGTSIIKVDSCPLFAAKGKVVKAVSGALSYLATSHQLDFERIGIRTSQHTGQTEVALWTRPAAFPRAQVAKVLEDALKPNSVVRVMSKGPTKARKIAGVEVLSGQGFWTERIGGERMYLSAPSFFQVNTKAAEKLQELVLSGLKPQSSDVAMDLYCGAGTFTLPLARACSWVDAVESYGPAVRDLRRNLDAAGLDNADPIGGDADLEFPDSDADIIVVDPPRAGLAASVVDKLSCQKARAIAYVSCDPATLARDLARFRERGVFKPTSITPVDLFPQTFHVETVVLMSRI